MSENPDTLFDPAVINKVRNPLIRILRLLYFQLGMTEQKFRDLHHRYITKFEPGIEAYKLGSARSNEKKLLKNERQLSWGKFMRGAVDIPEMDLKEVIMVFVDPRTKKERRISSLDRIGPDGEYVSHNDESESR